MQLIKVLNRWQLYYAEEGQQQFLKEQPELMLNPQGFTDFMISALTAVLRQYKYTVTTEGAMLKIADWHQVTISENDMGILVKALKPDSEIKSIESLPATNEVVTFILPARTFFQPSEQKKAQVFARIKPKTQIDSSLRERKKSSKSLEEKLIFNFGLFGNSNSPNIKQVQTNHPNNYIFIFVIEYIKMKMGNFIPLRNVYEEPKLNLGEGPGFKYSQEKINKEKVLVKLKGKNVDECPASTLGFQVQQKPGLPTPTFYIFNTWLRHNRTCHAARSNGPGKLPVVDS
ncbi:MAG: hypothetical protein JSR33_12315, partial [Proteobacteria bacterium]|nr:hypothetical protein [Pseudomonadota bacterium]